MIRLLPLCALLACTGKNDDTGADGARPDAHIVLTDAQNYSYQGSVDAPTLIAPEGQDFTLSWAGATQDIQCHDLDPAEDIDNVTTIVFTHLTEEEIEDGLSNDSLQQADMGGYVAWENTDSATECGFADQTFLGTDIDVEYDFYAENGTWLLAMTTGTVPGVGARLLAFLEPTPDTGLSQVDIPSGCGALDFHADLSSLSTIPALADGPWELDWSGLTTDGRGNPIELGNIDSLMLAFYEGQTPAQLQENFLDLKLSATHMYEIALTGGSTADLAQATGDEGAFTGFEGDGTWVIALSCSTCSNPAPLFLGVVDPG